MEANVVTQSARSLPRDAMASRVPRASRKRPEHTVDVSVCIVNWNCRTLLRRCLESIHHLDQGVRVETIVVDNASSDGAADMVACEFPEVRLVRNAGNVGFARGNNQAAQHARGRYVFFLNNDTALPAGCLRQLVTYAEAHPQVGILGPALRDGRGQRQVSHRGQPTLTTFLHRTCFLRWTNLLRPAYHSYRRQDARDRSPRAVDVLMGAALFMPRRVFLACGRWDEDFQFGGEDLELCQRVRRQRDVVFFPQVEITHFGRSSTRGNIGFASIHIPAGFARYLRKLGYSPLALLAYKLVITLDAPYQMLEKWLQFLWRSAHGRRDEAGRSLLVARSLLHFLSHGLPEFWKA